MKLNELIVKLAVLDEGYAPAGIDWHPVPLAICRFLAKVLDKPELANDEDGELYEAMSDFINNPLTVDDNPDHEYYLTVLGNYYAISCNFSHVVEYNQTPDYWVNFFNHTARFIYHLDIIRVLRKMGLTSSEIVKAIKACPMFAPFFHCQAPRTDEEIICVFQEDSWSDFKVGHAPTLTRNGQDVTFTNPLTKEAYLTVSLPKDPAYQNIKYKINSKPKSVYDVFEI